MDTLLTGAPAPAVGERSCPLGESNFAVRLLRLHDVLKIVPVSRSAWFAGIKAGYFPKGRHLRPRVTVWRSDEIDRLIEAVR